MSTEFIIELCKSRVPEDERNRILRNPGFGREFSDHMSTIAWDEDQGWHNARVSELKPFPMHPGSAILHYAQGVFEGLKAYGRDDGSVWLFRPLLNARRFRLSAERLALPPLSEDLFLWSVLSLVQVDRAWVPTGDGECSLYLRPFMFAADVGLGVRPSKRVVYAVIASPAGPYFPAGEDGIRLWVGRSQRAWKGGTGSAKFGGNYASTFHAHQEAEQNGCDQVLFLDADGFVDESATMNVFVVTSAGELLTPSLGTILAGVTRSSVLSLAVEHDLKPVERRISFTELIMGCKSGNICEVFAVGTAAVVTPIVGFRGQDLDVEVSNGRSGTHTQQLREHILDIQSGRRPDEFGWMSEVPL